MRLKKSQKEKVLAWIAEGLRSDEINARAATIAEPFSIDRRQVDYYRRTRKADLDAISRIGETTALIEGYALKEHRVFKLSLLAALMEKDIMGGFLWTDQVKGVGSGDIAEIIDYEEFNSAEVIAKETGGRVVKQEHTGAGGGPVTLRVVRDMESGSRIPDPSTKPAP
jgi:hypothetical protein